MNILKERFDFHHRTQAEHENIFDFVADVRWMASKCEFETQEEYLIRDRLLCGMKCRMVALDIICNGGIPTVAEIIEIYLCADEEAQTAIRNLKSENQHPLESSYHDEIEGPYKTETDEEHMLVHIKNEPLDISTLTDDPDENQMTFETLFMDEFQIKTENEEDSSAAEMQSSTIDQQTEPTSSIHHSNANKPRRKRNRRPFDPNQPIGCLLCSKPFQSRKELREHRKNMHNTTERLECSHCSKIFKRLRNLEAHLKSHHPETMPGYANDRQFECYICHKDFLSESILSRHIYGHYRWQSMVCIQCDYIATDVESMNTHRMFVHQGKAQFEKPFLCNVCGKRFPQKSQLDRHSAIHTGVKSFECVDCGKRFATRTNLCQHGLTHKEPRFNCAECERKFRSPGNLKKHMKVHMQS